MHLQTVTDLVNSLFTYYDCNLTKLDWDNKINEYVDVINDLITFDTDLDELYKTIRQDYKYRKLPTPYDIKNILSKSKAKAEIRECVEHPDNGKIVVIACYKNGKVSEIRDYVIHNTSTTKSYKEITKDLREKFDNIKVYEFCKGSTLIGNTVFIPAGYDSEMNVTEYKQQRIA